MPESGAELKGSANEGTAALVEAKEAVGGTGNADAGASAEDKGSAD